MQKDLVAGRPKGSRTFDPVIARSFGQAVQEARKSQGISQESLAALAAIDRAHMGRIERGDNLPTLVAVFKLASALGFEVYEFLACVGALLPRGHVHSLIKQAHADSGGSRLSKRSARVTQTRLKLGIQPKQS